jgi:lambda family phage portal protein
VAPLSRLDRWIAVVSPQRAVRRVRARLLLDTLGRAYEGSARGRRTEDWITADGGSASAETRYSLATLRNRSRDLCRNNPYGRRAVRRLATATVGSYGISATLTGPNQRAVAKITDLWTQWTASTLCDARGKQTFGGLQGLVARTLFESGEVLALRRWAHLNGGPPSPLSLRIQVIEPDYLDPQRDNSVPGYYGGTPDELRDGNRLDQGVELDGDDRPVAYWLFPRNPGDGIVAVGTQSGETGGVSSVMIPGMSSTRVDAANVLHVFQEERAGQVRGVPVLAPVVIRIRDLDQYLDTQLIRQKIAACFAVFLSEPEGTLDLVGTAREPIDLCDHVEPGMISKLPAGYEPSFAQPQSVEDKSFVTEVLQGIASGTGLPYEELAADYSQVNFSSARMARTAFYELVSELQWLVVIPQFCDRIFGWFRDACVTAGVPGADSVSVEWTTPRKTLTDPGREIPAIISGVRAGLMSPQEAIRELGYDVETVLDEWQAFTKMVDERGLVLDIDPRKVAKTGNPQPAWILDPTESAAAALGNGTGAGT